MKRSSLLIVAVSLVSGVFAQEEAVQEVWLKAYQQREALDPDRLESALRQLVDRHQSLRTSFAMIDGEPAEVFRTNVAFRGVVVPEGAHRVRFRYSASEFRLGFGLSGVGLILAAGVLIWGGLARARTSADAGGEA